MAVEYKTPGVYIEEIPKLPPSIASVETAIPAFIGYTQKATEMKAWDLKNKPMRITSLLEYEQYFGTAQPEEKITVTLQYHKDVTTNQQVFVNSFASLAEGERSKHIMYYAMQMFFENGGGPCYIVSAGAYSALDAPKIDPVDLENGIDAVRKEDEPTLLVVPEAQSLDTADFKSVMDAKALRQCADLQNRFVIMDVNGGTGKSLSEAATNLLDAVGNFRDNGIGVDNLKYGAAYAPNVETVFPFAYDETKVSVSVEIDGAAPASPLPTLDSFKASDNQKYELAKAAIGNLTNKLPPSPMMAGIYAAVDNSRGVWKAPANVTANGVIRPTIAFSNGENDQMNVDTKAGKSVNAIRPFIGKGTLVWGARTLAGNDNEWRYINVRRLFIMAEQSVKNATSQFVFEANDANTWVKIQAMVENYLTTLWRQGALQGVKPTDAFYVSVGLGKTMSALDILEGRLIVEIGMAAVRPAEFIVLRFSHMMATS